MLEVKKTREEGCGGWEEYHAADSKKSKIISENIYNIKRTCQSIQQIFTNGTTFTALD